MSSAKKNVHVLTKNGKLIRAFPNAKFEVIAGGALRVVDEDDDVVAHYAAGSYGSAILVDNREAVAQQRRA